MAGSLAPYFFQQWFDNVGDPAAGYQLFTYQSGTTTKQPTYQDSALSIMNTNPIKLDSAGMCKMFLVPGISYTMTLALPSDTDPPTSPVRNLPGVQGIPVSGASPDVTGTVGDTFLLGEAAYLSDGSGGKVAGHWYLTSASNTYSSTLPAAIGMATGPITSGTSGTIRLIGQVTGLSSLAAGTVYYLDTTAGAITSSPPANARAIGIADSTTSLVLSQGTGILAASATTPGIITTGAQTIPGAKTFPAAAVFSAGLTSAAGVTSSSTSAGVGYATGAGGTISQITSKSTGVTLNKICGQVTMHNAALNATTGVNFTLSNTSIAAVDGVQVWIVSGATANSYSIGVDAVAANSCSINVYNRTAGPLSEAVVLGFAVYKAVTS